MQQNATIKHILTGTQFYLFKVSLKPIMYPTNGQKIFSEAV